jgi:hypothetical protein
VVGKVIDVHTKPITEPSGSAVPTASDAPEPARLYGRRSLARRTLAKFAGAIRGDKYMANAYPPAWRGDAAPVGLGQNHNDNASAAVQSSVTAPSTGTTYRPAPAPAGIEER